MAASRLFDSRYKLLVHIFEIVLIVAVLVLSLVKLLNLPKNAPRSRSNTMALGMSAKSLIIILYQLLSEHTQAFKKWASLKAYLILNALEIVFWAAVAFMSIQSITQFCEGFTCILSWIVVILGILMSTLAFYVTIISWLDFKHFRRDGTHRGHYGKSQTLEGHSTEAIAMVGEPPVGWQKNYDGQERLDVPHPAQPDTSYDAYSQNTRWGNLEYQSYSPGRQQGM